MSVPALDPVIRRRGLRRAEYDALVATGAFEGERVELFAGELIEMSPQGARHRWLAAELHRVLVLALGSPYRVASHSPIALDDESEPEPDVAVTEATSPDQLPSTVYLAVEISKSSLRFDLFHKAPRYAAGGVQELWVVDVEREEIVVHRDPSPVGYRSIERVDRTTVLTVLGIEIDLAAVLFPDS